MKANRYTFQWFKKEDRRKALRASVSREGKLRLGRPLRKALPPFIRVGFDRDARVLAIAEGRELDGDAAAAGSLNARLLSAQICSIGLKLPIAFSLRRDEATGFYLGTVIPRRQRDAATGQRHYDPEQLLTLYTPLIDRTVAHLAKSTPLSERKAIAAEALCAALPAYRPAMGELEGYLEEAIRRSLLTENRQYTDVYRHRSLDQPLAPESPNTFALYDAIPSSSGGIDELEERIMAQQFRQSLSAEEQALFQMLQDGRPVEEIALTLSTTGAQIQSMGLSIGEKRRRFYQIS